MLRRINAALFEAPVDVRIQVVAQAQGNNGVNDARFEYAGAVLPREIIQGLPGCSFDVQDSSQRLQAVVAFDGNATGAARYDLFEVENGVLNGLNKFTMKADGSPLIDFVIRPVEAAVAAAAGRRAAPRARRKAAAPRRARAKRAGKKTARIMVTSGTSRSSRCSGSSWRRAASSSRPHRGSSFGRRPYGD